jgi:hypothetical protein
MRRRFMVDWIVVVRAGVETEFVLIADDIFSRGRVRRPRRSGTLPPIGLLQNPVYFFFFFTNLCR